MVILAVAALLRLVKLDAVPPGMTHDEAAFGAEAEQVLAGQWPIYFSLGYGHEPVYAYLVAGAFLLFGHTLTAMRVTSAVCGLFCVLGTYLLARKMFGPRVGLVGAAWMAVAFWPLSLSRQALRAITLPMLWLPALWLFWLGYTAQVRGEGAQRLRFVPFTLAGLLLGGTFYTYMSSRVTWAVFPALAAYLAISKEGRAALRRTWPGFLTVLLVAGLVVLPLVTYLSIHPGVERRVGSMMGPIREFLQGKPQRIFRHTWNALRVFSWEGDQFWVYNIPGRPVFGWMGSLLFYAGIGIALWRWRDGRYAFLLLWLLIGMLPAMVTTNEGIFLRAIVAQPAAYVLVAVALEALYRGMGRVSLSLLRDRRWRQGLWLVLALGLVVMEGARTWQAYFVDWSSRPEARNIYNHNLVAIAGDLRARSPQVPVGVSALYPLYYHDPWIYQYVTGRDDVGVRWFDGRGGIVYPGEGDALYVFSALKQLDPALQSEFATQATLVERRELSAEDENPYFEVWQWHGGDVMDARLAALRENSWLSIGQVPPDPSAQRLVAGADFGDLVRLEAYRLSGQSFAPGQEIELVTYWRALRRADREDDWNTFVHLLDDESRVVGGADRLDCPPTGWQPGDVVVQVYRFRVANEDALKNRTAFLEIGVYRHSAGRLQVMVDGEPCGDRVLLEPIAIR